MNEAQKYLLDHGLNDLIINRPVKSDPSTWVYTSDVMMGFKYLGFPTPTTKGKKTKKQKA